MQAAQLSAVAKWLRRAAPGVRLETTGMRSHVAGLLAAALEPDLFSERVVRDGLPSWRYLLEAPVEYHAAPELFCFGCLTTLELDRLNSLASRR